MTSVLAIDPGSSQSAWLQYDGTKPGAFGITANVIAVGPFDTEMSREYRGSGTGIKTAEWYQKMLPVGRWGRQI